MLATYGKALHGIRHERDFFNYGFVQVSGLGPDQIEDYRKSLTRFDSAGIGGLADPFRRGLREGGVWV
jgi:hypothetical protein